MHSRHREDTFERGRVPVPKEASQFNGRGEEHTRNSYQVDLNLPGGGERAGEDKIQSSQLLPVGGFK